MSDSAQKEPETATPTRDDSARSQISQSSGLISWLDSDWFKTWLALARH